MATEQGMFGPNPLDVQDQLTAQAEKQITGLDLAGLAGRAGIMVGQGLNRMLGREDPRVSEAKQVQEAVNEVRQSGVDMSDPAAYYRKMAGIFGAKGLTKQAEMAAAKALEFEDKKEQRAFGREKMANERQLFGMKVDQEKLQLEEAQAKLAIAKAKSQGKPWKTAADEFVTKNFKEIDPKSLTAFWEALDKNEGNISLAAAALIKNEDPEKKTKAFEANGVQYVYDPSAAKANPKDAHPTLKDYVAAGKSTDRAPRVSVTLPSEDRQLAFDLDQIGKGKDEVKEVDKQIRALDNAYALLGNKTPAASSMGIRVLAGAIQTGTLSKNDVSAVDNTGSLFDRLQNYASKGITGVPTDTVTKDLQLGIKVLRQKTVESREETLKPYRNAAKRTNRDTKDLFPEAPPLKEPGQSGVKSSTLETIEQLKRERK